jgi:hypothetical protein
MHLKDYYRSRLSHYSGDILILDFEEQVKLLDEFCRKRNVDVENEYLLGRLINRDFTKDYWQRQLRAEFLNFGSNHFQPPEYEEDFITTEFFAKDLEKLIVLLGKITRAKLFDHGVYVDNKRVFDFWGLRFGNEGVFMQEKGFSIRMGWNGK